MVDYNVIPPITDPLGRGWEQPDTKEILVDDDYAVMSKKAFDELKDYTASQPTTLYNGKMWKIRVRSKDSPLWVLRYCCNEDKEKNLIDIAARKILILGSNTKGEESMFTLRQVTPTAGDCTAGYDVHFRNSCTLREFIEEVLKRNPGEWGYFELKNMGVHTEYRDGRLIKQNFADFLLDSRIVKGFASGGWTRMDYILTLELKDENSDNTEEGNQGNGSFHNGNNHTALPVGWTAEQQTALDILCYEIDHDITEQEKTIEKLISDNRQLRQKAYELNNMVRNLLRKENEQ